MHFTHCGLIFLLLKNIICGIVYLQHNSPERFRSYFEGTVDKLTSTGKPVYVMGDYNKDLLKSDTSRYSRLLLLEIFLSTIYPEQVMTSGNIISDISDNFSQFCIIR